MLNSAEILQTINMFDRQHLDIRTIMKSVGRDDPGAPFSGGRGLLLETV